ncbi:hypothetical protein AX16_003768 [Volvariella volvacea WC 439]|nr:hypothetical protein AX16_003768 [Volvariella volvacea WC 439]
MAQLDSGSALPNAGPAPPATVPRTRGYQQEMLNRSLHQNIIIALDTGAGKTHIAVLRVKHEVERTGSKLSWFLAPTVALAKQQRSVIATALPVPVGVVSGESHPDQWKDPTAWSKILATHRVVVSTPQVLLDALRHGYVVLSRDISLLIFDEAHHAADNHPYNRIMQEYYFAIPQRVSPHQVGSVRPMVLGLTASPIYGGNPHEAFKIIEGNLDSIICAPQRYQSELAQHVHRPVFKHCMYMPADMQLKSYASTNLSVLSSAVSRLEIEDDPYVKSLRQQLTDTPINSIEWRRLDQQLSEVIHKQNSYTHQGLRDFVRTANEVAYDVGSWAADWYIWNIVDRAKRAARLRGNFFADWKNEEKQYLFQILQSLKLEQPIFDPGAVSRGLSDKGLVLIHCLLAEKWATEKRAENYSSIVFVQRRDTVLALAEVLKHHPQTVNSFSVGCLLGAADGGIRHDLIDIHRELLTETQEETLSDFKSGDKNLIISTSVAEEGIDVQACCSVIRWDPPQNMASWAQSRGRARRRKSTFTVMFEVGSKGTQLVRRWEDLERQMVALYNDPAREVVRQDADQDDEDEELSFKVQSTGATLTLHSAVSHLAHFCAVLPNTIHAENRPIYEVSPREYPEGWHVVGSPGSSLPLHPGPFGATVTLPRTLPPEVREFSVPEEYRTKASAMRHVAYKAYLALYEAGLLNEHLLPFPNMMEPELDAEVKQLMKVVERREGTAQVTVQIDPWSSEREFDIWWCSELTVDGLPPLQLYTRSELYAWQLGTGPFLYRSNGDPIQFHLQPRGRIDDAEDVIPRAQVYTRRLFWSLYGTRMDWNKTNFSYLFLPSGEDSVWEARREWTAAYNVKGARSEHQMLYAIAKYFGEAHAYPTDLALVRSGAKLCKAFRFVSWRYEKLLQDEEDDVRRFYEGIKEELEISYPVIVAERLPTRANLLIPTPKKDSAPLKTSRVLLLSSHSAIVMQSAAEMDVSYLLPSILRHLALSSTAKSLQYTMFKETPLEGIPIRLLTTATTTPMAQEQFNYQRLETLGDAALKFIVGVQLIGEYPLWHEGYLTRKKDHAVSNVRLAKEGLRRGLYRWMIRDQLLPRKWRPTYITNRLQAKGMGANIASRKGSDSEQELSTKMLADVVESLIGAAYIHGGIELGYECCKFFDLGLKWKPVQERLGDILARVQAQDSDDVPFQVNVVERMLGYTFKYKAFLIEALTHASYQHNLRSMSYERMEFLGDSVLDMIVTDYLYHAPGKAYSPGHIHLRKAAVVNAHTLAFICLRTFAGVEATTPQVVGRRRVTFSSESQKIYLWQCLLHSSPRILEDQTNTLERYHKRKEEIEAALESGSFFPWAALLGLQAPKFFSDIVESLIGAIYLDSYGDMEEVRKVVGHLGLMEILERVVSNDLDVLHPVSRLGLWASKHSKTLEYVFSKEKGKICCTILLDGQEEVKIVDEHRGKASQEEVKFKAAEEAIRALHLRSVGMNYTLMKKLDRRIKPQESY